MGQTDLDMKANQTNSKIFTPQGSTKKSPPLSQASTWFVYLLRCADQSLYCGITTNLEKRLKQHNGDLVGGGKIHQSTSTLSVGLFRKSTGSK